MGLLKSVKDVPGIDYNEYRDELYYNKYQYRARFVLEGVRYTWYTKTPEELEKRINAKKPSYYGIRKEDRSIVLSNLETIKQFISWRNQRKIDKNASIRVEYNTVAVFSNDLSLLQSLESLGNGLEVDYTQVQTSKFVGVKTFVNEPKHNYRIYLKSKVIEGSLIIDLYDLIQRTPGLYPSESLKYWLKGAKDPKRFSYSWRYRHTNATHFIDYDDESTLSYLALMHGEYLGKRYKLEKRPETI